MARLIRNLVWQMKERVAAGEKEFNELIRTYWHMYIKPTLARAGSLTTATGQYKQLTASVAKVLLPRHSPKVSCSPGLQLLCKKALTIPYFSYILCVVQKSSTRGPNGNL